MSYFDSLTLATGGAIDGARAFDPFAYAVDGWAHSDGTTTAARVNGQDVINFVGWSTFRMSQSLARDEQHKQASFTMYAPGFRPIAGHAVEISLPAGQVLFRGRIVSCPETDAGADGEVIYQVACVGYGADLDRRMVSVTFDSGNSLPAGYSSAPYSGVYDFATMVRYLIDNFANLDTYGATIDTFDGVTYVASGGPSPMPTMQFDHVPLGTAISELASRAGMYWYVDDSKYIHAFPDNAGAAPMTLDDDYDDIGGLSIDYDSSQIRNRVILAGKIFTSTRKDSFMGDQRPGSGQQASFTLQYPIFSKFDISSIVVHTTGSTVTWSAGADIGQDGWDSVTNAMVVPQSNSVYVPYNGIFTFLAWTSVDVYYTSHDYGQLAVEDTAARAEMAEIMGCSTQAALAEQYIELDDSIRDVQTAILKGNIELRQWARPRLRGSFTWGGGGAASWSGGVISSAMAVPQIGQLLPLRFTRQRRDWRGQPLSTDALIQSVEFQMLPADTLTADLTAGPEYLIQRYGIWTVTFGDHVYGLQQLLGDLYRASRKSDFAQYQPVHHLLVFADTLTITPVSLILTHKDSGGTTLSTQTITTGILVPAAGRTSLAAWLAGWAFTPPAPGTGSARLGMIGAVAVGTGTYASTDASTALVSEAGRVAPTTRPGAGIIEPASVGNWSGSVPDTGLYLLATLDGSTGTGTLTEIGVMGDPSGTTAGSSGDGTLYFYAPITTPIVKASGDTLTVELRATLSGMRQPGMAYIAARLVNDQIIYIPPAVVTAIGVGTGNYNPDPWATALTTATTTNGIAAAPGTSMAIGTTAMIRAAFASGDGNGALKEVCLRNNDGEVWGSMLLGMKPVHITKSSGELMDIAWNITVASGATA